MKIYYGKAIYNNKEISAAVKVLKRKSLTLIDGPSVKELEKKISKLFGFIKGMIITMNITKKIHLLSIDCNLSQMFILHFRPNTFFQFQK